MTMILARILATTLPAAVVGGNPYRQTVLQGRVGVALLMADQYDQYWSSWRLKLFYDFKLAQQKYITAVRKIGKNNTINQYECFWIKIEQVLTKLSESDYI